jgi:hypothetical protein
MRWLQKKNVEHTSYLENTVRPFVKHGIAQTQNALQPTTTANQNNHWLNATELLSILLLVILAT